MKLRARKKLSPCLPHAWQEPDNWSHNLPWPVFAGSWNRKFSYHLNSGTLKWDVDLEVSYSIFTAPNACS